MSRRFRKCICSSKKTVTTSHVIARYCHIINRPSIIIFSSNMPSLKRPSVFIDRPPAKQRKCVGNQPPADGTAFATDPQNQDVEAIKEQDLNLQKGTVFKELGAMEIPRKEVSWSVVTTKRKV